MFKWTMFDKVAKKDLVITGNNLRMELICRSLVQKYERGKLVIKHVEYIG